MLAPKPQPNVAAPQAQGTPWAENTVEWTPDPRAFPMTRIHRGSFWAGVTATLTGSLFTSLPLAAIVGGSLRAGFHWLPTAMMLPFLVAGLLILLYGISRFLSRRVVVLREEDVEVDEVGFFERRHWKELIRKYEGVLKRLHYYGNGSGRASDTYYEIVLKHPDRSRNVVLFRSRSWKNVDTEWRNFAKRLKIPALEESPDGLVRVSPFALDQFLRDRMRGKEVAWWDPQPADFSPRLTLATDRHAFRVTHSLAWGKWKEVQGIIASAFLGAAAAFLFPPLLQGPGMALASLLVLVFFLRVLWRGQASEELYFSYAGVEHRIVSPWGYHLHRQFPTELINNVQVRRTPGPFPSLALHIDAGRESIRFGHHLTEDDKEKLRELVIMVLIHGPNRMDLS